jgi:hypothetical protein
MAALMPQPILVFWIWPNSRSPVFPARLLNTSSPRNPPAGPTLTNATPKKWQSLPQSRVVRGHSGSFEPGDAFTGWMKPQANDSAVLRAGSRNGPIPGRCQLLQNLKHARVPSLGIYVAG